MSRCNLCRRDGLLFIRDLDSHGYVVCVCTCELGKRWKVKWQFRAFVAQLDPAPIGFGRLEEFFSPAEISTLHYVEGWHPTPDHPVGQ